MHTQNTEDTIKKRNEISFGLLIISIITMFSTIIANHKVVEAPTPYEYFVENEKEEEPEFIILPTSTSEQDR